MEHVLDIAIHVSRVLDRLGVRHILAGSLASSLHGLPRSTQDVDFVADIDIDDVDALVEALAPAFYIDAGAVRQAIRDRTRFNAIHLETMFKVDVYLPGPGREARSQFSRSRAHVVAEASGERLEVASPEDTIAHKLYWYRLGGEVSERQWSDALGVIRVQGAALDRAYLKKAASLWGVADLLERALAGAEPE